MTRKFRTSSRQPGPTEAEIALQWEITRLRGELTETRKLLGANDQGLIPGDRLEGKSLARFYETLGLLNQRLLEQWVPAEARCAQCGGVSPERLRATFADAATAAREG